MDCVNYVLKSNVLSLFVLKSKKLYLFRTKKYWVLSIMY